MWNWIFLSLTLVIVAACQSGPPPQYVLEPPAGTPPGARASMQDGNHFYAGGQWLEAQHEYEKALALEPTLAEAHYNLAMTLEKVGKLRLAREHYLEAANLAPGHKIIWDSPPLRKHGDVKSTQPATNPNAVFNPVGGAGSGLGY